MKRALTGALLLCAAAWAETNQPPLQAGSAALSPIQRPQAADHVASAIPALTAEARGAILALEEQLATDPGNLELALRIEERKAEFELRRLELLAAECREQGRESEARMAEERLAALRTPRGEDGAMSASQLTPEEKAQWQARQPKPEPKPVLAPAGPSTLEGGR